MLPYPEACTAGGDEAGLRSSSLRCLTGFFFEIAFFSRHGSLSASLYQ